MNRGFHSVPLGSEPVQESPAGAYRLLQNLASPLVAVTVAHAGRANGCIVNSAVRASIAPRHPRVGVYLHKFNLTHELVAAAGAFALHLLRDDQWELIHRLGFGSGRDRNKLAGVPSATGVAGNPLLEDCFAALDCRVANTMDGGAATFFLGDVLEVRRGVGERIMTAAHFRANAPTAMRAEYEANLRKAQEWADAHARIGPPRADPAGSATLDP